MTLSPSVHVSKHPIIAQKLSQLRDHSLKPKAVRELTRDISVLLGYEASSDITLVKGKEVRNKIIRCIFCVSNVSMGKFFFFPFRHKVNMVPIKHPR